MWKPRINLEAYSDAIKHHLIQLIRLLEAEANVGGEGKRTLSVMH